MPSAGSSDAVRGASSGSISVRSHATSSGTSMSLHDRPTWTSSDASRQRSSVAADGAFWSPFAPTTVAGGDIDTTLRVCEAIEPLGVVAGPVAARVARRPMGADALLGVR